MRSIVINAWILATLILLACPALYSSGTLLPGRNHFVIASVASGSVSTNGTQYEMLQHPLPKGSSAPWALASDKLGRIWIAEQGSNQLGMFDPSTSSYQEYSIPAPNSSVNSVAVDNSGNVWVTGLATNRLFELKNGSSTFTEYAIPNHSIYGSCGPTGVISGPFEHIWILCIFSNQIDEFFPNNGSFAGFDLPIFQSGPAGLVFDHDGNFWFTAADADMLGHVVVSELQNGTSNGIEEFAPHNQTYTFTFSHAVNLEGNSTNLTSSLPTPSGIAISPDGNTLWVSEHVDSSFDSYNIASQSLVRFWTSKTDNAFGYDVSFPNGLAVGSNGNIWIAEHYGNKIANFDPNSDSLTEYVVPCCNNSAAGVYTLALGANDTVWFVEIFGNAIGELKPVASTTDRAPISVSLIDNNPASLGGSSASSSITIPVELNQNSYSSAATNVSLDISGISSSGQVSGITDKFSPAFVVLEPGGRATSNLTISLTTLSPGTYYLTVSAQPAGQGVIYSSILKLIVAEQSTSDATRSLFIDAALIGTAVAIVVVGTLAFVGRRRRANRGRRRSKKRGVLKSG